MHRLKALWIAIRSSLWFIPAVVAVLSIGSAEVLVELGRDVKALQQSSLPTIFAFGADGSHAMLSSIATSMITVAGVAFSVTIVALSLASAQYSPRVLRQFMRDRRSQWVLGVFVGAFAFCLAVLPRIRGGDESGFVPALAVFAAVVYALIGVGCLIYFIHHVANSIQASYIVSEITAETNAVARALFPEAKAAPAAPDVPDVDCAYAVPVGASGYLQLIGELELARVAERHNLVLRVAKSVGEFCIEGTPIVWVDRPVDNRIAAQLGAAVTLARTRTVEQDVLFGIQQIVDVALRALSPSLNDPTTAVICVDHLTAILRTFAGRRMGTRRHCRRGRLRLTVPAPTLVDAISAAFDEIQANAASQVLVLGAMVRGISTLEPVMSGAPERSALQHRVRRVEAALQELTGRAAALPLLSEARRLTAALG